LEWQDHGVVLGGRAYGETSVIVELLTARHGRHLGMVRGGRSRRLRPVLQPGNSVAATWRARTDDHMGTYVVEGLALRAARAIGDAIALHALNHLCGLARLLPERDPHPILHGMLDAMMDNIEARETLPLQMVQFELSLLAELGFGLDLKRCAATQSLQDLQYVSPRTGRAVSSLAGAPYRDRMLALPPFLRPDTEAAPVGRKDLAAAFRLTEHFMVRDIFAPRNLPLPAARRAYLALMLADP
jgi:DNA repair protein RecO (recombination protein O)